MKPAKAARKKKKPRGLSITIDEVKSAGPKQFTNDEAWWRVAYQRPKAGYLGIQPSGHLHHSFLKESKKRPAKPTSGAGVKRRRLRPITAERRRMKAPSSIPILTLLQKFWSAMVRSRDIQLVDAGSICGIHLACAKALWGSDGLFGVDKLSQLLTARLEQELIITEVASFEQFAQSAFWKICFEGLDLEWNELGKKLFNRVTILQQIQRSIGEGKDAERLNTGNAGGKTKFRRCMRDVHTVRPLSSVQQAQSLSKVLERLAIDKQTPPFASAKPATNPFTSVRPSQNPFVVTAPSAVIAPTAPPTFELRIVPMLQEEKQRVEPTTSELGRGPRYARAVGCTSAAAISKPAALMTVPVPPTQRARAPLSEKTQFGNRKWRLKSSENRQVLTDTPQSRKQGETGNTNGNENAEVPTRMQSKGEKNPKKKMPNKTKEKQLGHLLTGFPSATEFSRQYQQQSAFRQSASWVAR
jgi:hypothetical protein